MQEEKSNLNIDEAKNNNSLSSAIDSLFNYAVLKGDWLIDFDWGLQQLFKFSSEIETLSSSREIVQYYNQLKEESKSVHFYSIGSEQLNDVTNVAVGGKLESRGIANIRLSGSMFLEDGLCHYGINSFANTLRELDASSNVKGIILSVNSGGGEALAGQKLYNTVKELSTPVVAHLEFAGSAAYLGVLGADKIIAEDAMSSVGSIGAMTSINKEAIAAYKANYDNIYSDYSPNKNKTIRDYMEGNPDAIKDGLNQLAKEFQDKVKSHRPISYKSAETLAGGMFYGKDAKKRGLVDSIGSLNVAIKHIKNLIKS